MPTRPREDTAMPASENPESLPHAGQGSGPDARAYDVVVLGGGVAGENAADRAGRTGLSVALVENELVGGECSYWACIPSKVLLRPGAVLEIARGLPGAAGAVTGAIDVPAVLKRRDVFTHGWDDQSQVDWLAGAGIDPVRGDVRFTGPRAVEVTDADGGRTVLHARHAVIVATGSEPVLPDVPGLAEAQPWTSREATAVREVPESLVIVGGGVVAVEMATAYADLRCRVTVLVRGHRLLPAAEPFASRAVAAGLERLGVDVRFGTEAVGVRRAEDGVHVSLSGEGGGLVAAELLVATGRRPRTTDLGLDVLGLQPGRPLAVDDAMMVAAVEEGWLFAAGDVTGRTATTHQGKYDARVAGDVVADRFDPRASAAESPDDATAGDRTLSAADERGAGPGSRYRATADRASVPQVVFSRPEVAWVGLSEAAARAAGVDVRVVAYDLANVAGATVRAQDYAGRAQIVIDDARGVIVGATFVGPDVAEMLHAATIAVVGEVPLGRLWHAVPSYPTVSEVWLRLLETAGF